MEPSESAVEPYKTDVVDFSVIDPGTQLMTVALP
jgi:hypothetical protein